MRQRLRCRVSCLPPSAPRPPPYGEGARAQRSARSPRRRPPPSLAPSGGESPPRRCPPPCAGRGRHTPPSHALVCARRPRATARTSPPARRGCRRGCPPRSPSARRPHSRAPPRRVRGRASCANSRGCDGSQSPAARSSRSHSGRSRARAAPPRGSHTSPRLRPPSGGQAALPPASPRTASPPQRSVRRRRGAPARGRRPPRRCGAGDQGSAPAVRT